MRLSIVFLIFLLFPVPGFGYVTPINGGGGGGTWGSITGTLSSQSDLNTALGLKAPKASPTFTGNTVFPIGSDTTPAFGFGGGAANTLPGISASSNQGVLQFSVQNQSSGLAQEYMFLSQNNLGTPKNIFLNDYPTGTTADNYICASNDGDTLTVTGYDAAGLAHGGAVKLGGVSGGIANQILFYNNNLNSATLDASGNFNVFVSVMNAAGQTTLTGSAGTALCSEPEQGSSYKKVICYLSGYSTTSQTYTYPTAFAHTPYIYGLPGAVAVASSNTTTLTFTSAVTLTGFLFVEGY